MFKITIPFTLKQDWQNEKYLLEELENGKNGFLFKGNIEKRFNIIKINFLTKFTTAFNRFIWCFNTVLT